MLVTRADRRRDRGGRATCSTSPQSAPGVDRLHPILGGGSSQVFAADGTRLGFIQSDELRTPVGWSEIPADLKNATVAIEDQRFYKNNGVDLTGIFRAAVKDVTHGAALQGGSTITMQLMRNLYLGGDQHTLRQKIIEAKLAIDYEKRHGKRSILTSYLNSVPYGTRRRPDGDRRAGGGADLLRQTRLAAEPRSSRRCSPACRRRPRSTTRSATRGGASARRNEVLAKMAELHYISRAQAARRRGARRWKSSTATSTRSASEDFFFEYVREQLVHRYGAKTVAQGGLKVYTTIDLNMQRLARKAIAEVLNEPEDPASAIVTIDPANGDIEAMAESESYEQSQYNLAADGHRQPGSTFKAIVLADALSRGIDPNSTLLRLAHARAGLAAGLPDLRSENVRRRAERRDQPRLRRRSNPTTPSTRSSPPTSASDTVTEMAHKMGVTSPLHELSPPRRSAG